MSCKVFQTGTAEALMAVADVDATCFAYYDPMNYAQDITCPVLMQGGLIDPVSPPTSVWSVFNRLGTGDKSIVPIDGHGHDWSAAFDRHAWTWLKEKHASRLEMKP